MLTIAAAPKPFTNPHIRAIQRNAIRSWLRLDPVPTVILLGRGEGIAETAAEFGITHDPAVACNEFKTPILPDIIDRAERLSKEPLICFINSDILLVPRFSGAADVARRRAKRSFLMVGRCANADVAGEIDFSKGWEEREDILQNRMLRPMAAIDYFVFPRGTFHHLPPFAIGRARYDNWMILHALQKGIPVIDATAFATVIHQNHDYGHVQGGRKWSYWGPEAVRNLELAGGWMAQRSLDDATHRIGENGRIRRPVRTNVRALHDRWRAWRSRDASCFDVEAS